MDRGILINQSEAKKIIAKALGIDEKQITTTKYSYMIFGITEEKILNFVNDGKSITEE